MNLYPPLLSLLHYKFTTSIRDGARVHHRRLTGPGLALPDSRISTDRARRGGAGLGPSQKAGRLSGPLHGWNGHDRSLVPSTGGADTAVLWFLARAERGLEEECCAATGERRRRTEKKREEEKRRVWPGGGALRCCRREKRRRRTKERREEKKRREILIGADQDHNLFFSVATLLCFHHFFHHSTYV